MFWSERRDSNSRPSAPKADALPGCATLRQLAFYPAKPSRPGKRGVFILFGVLTKKLSVLRIVGCKLSAAAHFSPSSCPIAGLLGCKSGKNCARWGRFSLSALQVRQPPRAKAGCAALIRPTNPPCCACACTHFLRADYAAWTGLVAVSPSPPGGGLGWSLSKAEGWEPATLAAQYRHDEPPSQPSTDRGKALKPVSNQRCVLSKNIYTRSPAKGRRPPRRSLTTPPRPPAY